MRIYDCFTFYNEFELLELRLESLHDFVDYFIIVEADKTQRNESNLFISCKISHDSLNFFLKLGT